MKKNAQNCISKKLKEIPGGVCAPAGFRAGGVFCDSNDVPARKMGFSIVVSDRRCPCACVYANGASVGAPLKITKKHLKYGTAQAAFVNSGIANVFQPNGEKFAKNVCKFIEKCGIIETADVMIGSTGRMGGRLDMLPYEQGITALSQALSYEEEGSMRAAEAMMTTDRQPKQVSYAFDLGNYICNFGAIFKGNSLVSPNMATVLGIITTDTNISPEMLQKALESAVKESFNQLNLDGASSPNDMVCIMASGKAGNYKIDCEDTEYKKFAFALLEVMKEMCRRIAADGAEKTLLCRINNAKSKSLSRALSKQIVGAYAFKNGIKSGDLNVECILGMLMEQRETIEGVEISLCSENGSVVLFSDGELLRRNYEREKLLLEANEIELCIQLNEGNFSSVAYGCI